MIISKTPLRVSLAGGGSDLPAYYRRFGGAVLSTAIDKFVYVTVNPKFDNAIRVSYSRTEEVSSVDQIEHPIVRACLNVLALNGGVEITSVADIPSRGTGLGSSSSFTVGLLHALAAYKGQYRSQHELASGACQVEIEICGARIGKQDQYAAAFGGLNFITFHPNDSVTVEPVICSREFLEEIHSSMLMFYTGKTRSASDILAHQSDSAETSADTQGSLRQLVKLTGDLRIAFHQGDGAALGGILHEGWMRKRSIVSGISSFEIDEMYEKARAAGALGGKLLGAGGGGFLLFYVPENRREDVKKALGGLRCVPFSFEPEGSRIVFFQRPS